MIQFNTAIVPF